MDEDMETAEKDEAMEVEEKEEDNDYEANEEDEEDSSDDQVDEDDEDDEGIRDMVARRRRRQTQRTASKTASASNQSPSSNRRRSSSRSGRFQGSLREPPTDSVRDLFAGVPDRIQSPPSPPKSPARRHARNRKKSMAKEYQEDDEEDEEEAYASESSVESYTPRKSRSKSSRSNTKYIEDEEDDDEDQLKIQRILASRTETKAKWRELGQTMNSSEVTDGSRWFQPPDQEDESMQVNDDDEQMQERFLVKWSDTSFLHVSWETHADLLDQVEGAKTYLSTFFRKAENGILLSADDRKDGDYFDPAYTQIGRILESFYEDKAPKTWEEELTTTNATFDICLDKTDEEQFETGTGRQFLIKWEGLPYSEASYEFERDLILADIDYKTPLKEFYDRTTKPNKTQWKNLNKQAETSMRKAYQLFGDNYTSTDPKEREDGVTQYQQELANHVYRNGGQLRDYQAEGVTWFLSNYINQRSCIMADEMGLGKTLQTAAFVHLLVTKMFRPGPFLIVVPLSTMAHWQREFQSWTGLNTIVYHGSAQDRMNLRMNEFAYPQDRPDRIGSNTIYLNKCASHRVQGKAAGPWMATVVVTTPEMIVADDWNELAAVPWEVLVVDEAHRLKNHTSKLATTLRHKQFSFQHKVLLTGTPIQNDIKEFWTLLNFIDDENFPDMDEFMERYGEIKSKERIDEMHETIRPYILRRLKEDVEKSVPPKEETLIEVELTLAQKQYYRALYEKNVGFLHKNKKKALDGPSLNNLAMQLRKCCNHLFLLNGVEAELRDSNAEKNTTVSEADLLLQGSGKLILLDKLLPRLQSNGHRILIFSQFKIMLDVLEDYLVAKSFSFERIDGSITGHKRQAAIDRFQDPNSKNPPFVMLLSTRAGGVGINLTSADTCIIYDSDWNPQNDLQAQARCHRIGQTKNVKVYRLLSRKSYEMQMFHMSSLKMGLDQAVLKGFESSGSGGEGTMSKEEVERLLRHGAYDIFNEEKAGSAEAESNDFIQQDIDSILQRRARTVVHENTGSGAAGGTFSKASFVAKTPNGKQRQSQDDVDIEDPDFWKKMVGEAKPEAESVLKPRRRNKTNYSERFYERQLHQAIALDSDSMSDESSTMDESSDEDDEEESDRERTKWGGKQLDHWKKPQALEVMSFLERYGYTTWSWDELQAKLSPDLSKFSEEEIRRMMWSQVLLALCELAKEDAAWAYKRSARNNEKETQGDSLGAMADDKLAKGVALQDFFEKSFQKIWKSNSNWAKLTLKDALAYAEAKQPRVNKSSVKQKQEERITKVFYTSLWGSLEGRGWKKEDGEDETVFKYDKYKFETPSAVLNAVSGIHPELTKMVDPILRNLEQARQEDDRQQSEARVQDLTLNDKNLTFQALRDLLARYAPLQLVSDRTPTKRLPVGRRLVSACNNLHAVRKIIQRAQAKTVPLTTMLAIDGRAGLPHPLWSLDHDAVLLNSIVKHGWIDRDKACKAIVADKEIKWGYPFQESEDAETPHLSASEVNDLRETGDRACAFLEDFAEVIGNSKACNRDLIIESYGLRHHVDEDSTAAKWVVDEDLLQHVSGKNGDGSTDVLLEDLPTKKDMAKRAKTVIQKSIAAMEGGSKGAKSSSSGSKASQKRNHDFTVIDQGNRCCILLAEMIKCIARGSHTKAAKQMRLLGSQAYEEAITLQKMFQKKKSEEHQALSKELGRVADQIILARQSMKISAIPGKNLFRVMIGLEPLQPKIATDPVYPSQAYLDQQSVATAQSRKESWRKDEGALGEKAILRAFKKANEKSSDGVPNTFDTSENNANGFQLTMIEALMLLVFCTNALPLVTEASDGLESWAEAVSILEVASKDFHRAATEKLEKAKAVLKKFQDNPDTTDARTDAAKRVAAAEWEQAMADEAIRQAAGTKPDGMAKKSVMLLEKIRRHAENPNSRSKGAPKADNFLGQKVISWIGKELFNHATEFDLLDGAAVMGYSTTDILAGNPQYATTRVAAYIDKKSARQVIAQIALLARLKSLLLKDKTSFEEKVIEAANRSKKAGDIWLKRPEWWDDAQHCHLLLGRLDSAGFATVLADGSNFYDASEEDPPKSLRDLGLTKTSIQQKANMLVRELHSMDETNETLRLLEERQNRGAAKKQGFDRSLAECHTTSSGKTSSGKPGNGRGIQTGLHAFFTVSKSVSKKSKVVVLKGNDENESVLASLSKRKGSPGADKDSPQAQKKAKKIAPIFRVVPASKETEDAMLDPNDTQEKKIRTIVNDDGIIELVTVPE